jgi:hypothetical protein
LEEMYIGSSKIGIDFRDVDTDYLVIEIDDLRYDLDETPWSRSDVEDMHPGFYEMIFFLDFDELERTPGSITEFFCFFKIRILDDELFGHN